MFSRWSTACALLAIRAYQRYLSPYKGFCCAYRVATGRGSCSALGYRAIRRHGLWPGLGVLNERLERCGVASRRLHPPVLRRGRRQRGDCVPACDVPSCDVPFDLDWRWPDALSCDGMSDALRCLDCGDCGSRQSRRRPQDDAMVYIPPYTRLGPREGPRDPKP